jgi:hypothetical protein
VYIKTVKYSADLLLLNGNGCLHASLATWKAITKLGCTVLLHSPYRPDLVPSDFYYFDPLKDALCGTWFEDDKVIRAVKKFLHYQDKIWYGLAKHSLGLC